MNIIDAAIHLHYVTSEGVIESVKILRNWTDPKEAIRMMIVVYCRYHGISEEGFKKLDAFVDMVETADLQKSRIGLAAAIAFYGLFDSGKDGKTQDFVGEVFGVTKSTIRNNRPFYEALVERVSLNRSGN